MATNLISTLASCELCSQYFSDPRMLPCLHSFCYECLVKHYDAEKSERSCPTCKEPLEIPDGKMEALPKDLRSSFMAEVAEYEEMVSGKSNVSCDRCGNSDESMAFKFCCNCCECLCSWCTKDHTRCLKTRKHELIEVGEKKKSQDEKSLLNSIPHKPLNCQLHSDEVLKFYCRTCSLLICRDCMALAHSGHSYDRIEAIANNEKKLLLPVVEEAESAASMLENAMAKGEKVIQNVQVKQKSVDDEINKCFKNLQEALCNRKQALLARSSEIGLGKITALKLQGEEMKKLYNEIIRVCGKIREASEIYKPAEMLSAKGPLMKKLGVLMKQYSACSLDPCKTEFISTKFESLILRQEMERFGIVTGGSYAGNSTVSLYMPQAIKGKLKEVIVTTRDENGKPYGRGGETVKVKLQLIGSESNLIQGDVQDKKDGTYAVLFTPQSVGEHELCITVENMHIKSSPFVISIREPRTYTSLSCQQYYYPSSSPWDVAFGDNGEMFVVNYGYHCIQVMNAQGNVARTIGPTNGSYGTGHLQFSGPSGIAIRGDVIYVAETNNHRIQKFTVSAEYITTFGSNGSGNGQLYHPRGICVDFEGKVYVSEYSNSRVSVFGTDETFDHFITGNMSNPWGIAFDPVGNLHVANHSLNNVAVFTPEGKHVRNYGSGYLQQPCGIAIDPEGYVFVSEYRSTSSRLQIFDPQYNFMTTLTGFNYPVGVSLDKDGYVYVSDSYNKRVTKY